MKSEGSSPHSQVPVTFPILSESNPVFASPSFFLTIHFNIMLPSTPRSSKSFFLSGLPPNVITYERY